MSLVVEILQTIIAHSRGALFIRQERGRNEGRKREKEREREEMKEGRKEGRKGGREGGKFQEAVRTNKQHRKGLTDTENRLTTARVKGCWGAG